MTFARKIASTSLCIGLQVRGPGHLDTGRDRIQDVREGGFDSIATFYRVFRSVYGMMPGDVRASSFNALAVVTAMPQVGKIRLSRG